MNIMVTIEERARQVCPRIVFPESGEITILQTAQASFERGIAQPVLLGCEEEILNLAEKSGVSLAGINIVAISDEAKERYAVRFAEEQPDFTAKMMMRKLRDPLYFAAAMVHFHDADSFIAGYSYSTGDVILAASQIIGYSDNVSTISSFNVVSIPGFIGSEGDTVIFTDVAVCVNPSSQQLADIALLAANAAKKLLDWTPRVAFLSYSTRSSGESALVDKVVNAVSIMNEKYPEITADGEFQLEVALSRSAAQKKIEELGNVAGQANIVVFPDINAGNTNIKAVKLFSHANSIGPILTGFRKQVSDLSRTGSLEHLVGTVAAVAALCAEDKT